MSAKIIPFPQKPKKDELQDWLEELGLSEDDILQIDKLLMITDKIIKEDYESQKPDPSNE